MKSCTEVEYIERSLYVFWWLRIALTRYPRGTADKLDWGQVLWIIRLQPALQNNHPPLESGTCPVSILDWQFAWNHLRFSHLICQLWAQPRLGLPMMQIQQALEYLLVLIIGVLPLWPSWRMALQNRGVAWGSTTILASNPWNVPNPSCNTVVFLIMLA